MGTLASVHKVMFVDTEHIIRMTVAPKEGIIIYLFNLVWGFFNRIYVICSFSSFLKAYYVVSTFLRRQKFLSHAFDQVECVYMNYDIDVVIAP